MEPASAITVALGMLAACLGLIALVFAFVMLMATALDGGPPRRKRTGGVFVGGGATGSCAADGGGGE